VAGAEDFRSAAIERRRDAAKLRDGARHLAAIYILGYAVECGLKAFLELESRRVPRGGSAGHDLLGLWEAAGFKRLDVSGYRRLFLDEWSVALRYREALPSNADAAALYRGGCELASFVQKKYNRPKPRRKRH